MLKHMLALNMEQELTDNLGAFARISWNDGRTQNWMYTEMDRAVSGGLSLRDLRWSTNTVERAIRPLCLGRKNALFASGDEGGERWAAVASLVETCKLNGVDPQRYFTDLLNRLVNGWPNSRIDELMPWCWAKAENG